MGNRASNHRRNRSSFSGVLLVHIVRRLGTPPHAGEDLGQDQPDRRTRYFKFCGFQPARGTAVITPPGARIQNPDVGYSKLAVILNSFLHPAHRVFRRQDFYASERWLGENLLHRLIERDETYIRNAESGR